MLDPPVIWDTERIPYWLDKVDCRAWMLRASIRSELCGDAWKSGTESFVSIRSFMKGDGAWFAISHTVWSPVRRLWIQRWRLNGASTL